MSLDEAYKILEGECIENNTLEALKVIRMQILEYKAEMLHLERCLHNEIKRNEVYEKAVKR